MGWAEAKWTVDSLLQKLGQAPNNMRDFKVTAVSPTSIGLRFLEPEDSYADGNLICAVGGVMIRMSQDHYPINPADGELVVDNSELGKYSSGGFTVEGLTESGTYYFSAFPYSVQGVFNLSSNEANRLSETTRGAETVVVTLDVDNADDFESVDVSLYEYWTEEVIGTATLTMDNPVATFFVPDGDHYGIRYGEAEGYITPSEPEGRSALAGMQMTYTASYRYFAATIIVTADAYEKATIVCEKDGTKYSKKATSGSVEFTVHKPGYWNISAKSSLDKYEEDAGEWSVASNGDVREVTIAFKRKFAVAFQKDGSEIVAHDFSTVSGLSATASTPTTPGHSDFDDYMPWRGITKVTLSTGDVMVRIPKFYYTRNFITGGSYVDSVGISPYKLNGYKVHPAFKRGDVELDYIYIGAYMTSANIKSEKGVVPGTDKTRSTWRSDARSKGSGWGLIDIATVSAVQMLMMVEFATLDMQTAIGFGYMQNNMDKPTFLNGVCDNVPNLTGCATGGHVVWRGIENFWGAYNEFVDGLNFLGTTYYVCNEPSHYADNVTTNYTALSYYSPTYGSSQYITNMGVDPNNLHVLLPSAAGSGSSSTYFCDTCDIASETWSVAMRGGMWDSYYGAGLFNWGFLWDSERKTTKETSRLMYIPQ